MFVCFAAVYCLLLGARTNRRMKGKGRPSFPVTRRPCICVDCKWVDQCTSYHFVEEKHEQPHLTATPQFTPRPGSPGISVSIRKEGTDGARRHWNDDNDLSGDKSDVSGDADDGQRISISIPMFTTEYDVVRCADFQEDKGRWVRLMPDEIKRANPSFVPS
mmetsp:Transcript_34919/g.58813  ORF Transcript_34919/g.58813 Transcript_34919/m.58813 type:complete len:161 (+) Transcript_34919:104-586(+)